MKKFLTGTIILFFIPSIALAQFNQSNYVDGDTVSFTSDASTQEYLWVWFGTADDTDPTGNMFCDWDTSYNGGSATMIPHVVSPFTECFYDNNSGQPAGGASTTANEINAVADMLDGTYYWIEPDGNDTCDATSAQSYNDCIALGDYLNTGSFTVNAVIDEFERIGTGFYFFGETNDSAEEQTTEQLATALQTNINSGVWQTTLLAISVFLAFYILQKIIMFFGYAYRKTNKIKIKK